MFSPQIFLGWAILEVLTTVRAPDV